MFRTIHGKRVVRKTFDTLKREREIVHLEHFGLIGEYEHFYTLDLRTLLLAL